MAATRQAQWVARTVDRGLQARALKLHALGHLQLDEVHQQDGVAHDDPGQRDHADHAGGSELGPKSACPGITPMMVSGMGAMMTSGSNSS